MTDADSRMDNASKKNLNALFEAGMKNAQRYRTQLHEIAGKLIANHVEPSVQKEVQFENRLAG
ncbi:MAG: hypothetical protein AAF587_22610 [Bacteroidota bacterium]